MILLFYQHFILRQLYRNLLIGMIEELWCKLIWDKWIRMTGRSIAIIHGSMPRGNMSMKAL